MNFIEQTLAEVFESRKYHSNDLMLNLEDLKDTDTLIRDAFETVAPDFKFDKRLCARIASYYHRLTRDDANIKWFGGCLLGTEHIRFTDRNRDEWFDSVLEIDEDYLGLELEKTGLVANWNVSSDEFNNSCVWLIHKAFQASPHFKDPDIRETCKYIFSILQFKFYTSLYFNQFSKGLVDLPAAEAAYAALTLKFAIKQTGSWQSMIERRSENFLKKDSPHYQTYKDYKEINSIIYVMSDMQTRTRSTFYDYYNELDKIRKSNARLGVYSDTITIDGEDILRDAVRMQEISLRYLLNSSTNTSSFVSQAYLDVVSELVNTSSPYAVKDALIAISTLPPGKDRDTMEDVMQRTLLITFEYIRSNKLKFSQITYLLTKIRFVITAAKSTDKDILFIRNATEKFISKKTHLKHGTTLKSARTAVLLYFIIKGLSANRS